LKETHEAQAACHRLLEQCVNGGPFFSEVSERASRAYARWCSLLPPQIAAAPARSFRIAPYAGSCPDAWQLSSRLERIASADLLGLFLHGSLATDEQIPYSDFDALVIIKDEVMRDPARLARVSRQLAQARRFMFSFDPLQHHGWFVLTEADLNCHSEARFPLALFPYCRALQPRSGINLVVRLREPGDEFRTAFASVVRSFRATLVSGRYLRNMYDLKNLLSTFMLLPALYLQARDGQGVYKRESFELARPDFAPSEWQPMDDVSRLRLAWSCHLAGVRRWLMTAVHPWRRHVVRLVAPPLPVALREPLGDGLPDRMARLATRMEERLSL
jgi:hypothetical protein